MRKIDVDCPNKKNRRGLIQQDQEKLKASNTKKIRDAMN